MTTALLFLASAVLCFGVGYIIGMVRTNRAIIRLMETPVEDLKKGDR